MIIAPEASGSISGTRNTSGRYGTSGALLILRPRRGPFARRPVNMLSRTVFYNGKIFTSEEGDASLHDTLVIEGDKVGFIGDREGGQRFVEQVRVDDWETTDASVRMSSTSTWVAGSCSPGSSTLTPTW